MQFSSLSPTTFDELVFNCRTMPGYHGAIAFSTLSSFDYFDIALEMNVNLIGVRIRKKFASMLLTFENGSCIRCFIVHNRISMRFNKILLGDNIDFNTQALVLRPMMRPYRVWGGDNAEVNITDRVLKEVEDDQEADSDDVCNIELDKFLASFKIINT